MIKKGLAENVSKAFCVHKTMLNEALNKSINCVETDEQNDDKTGRFFFSFDSSSVDDSFKRARVNYQRLTLVSLASARLPSFARLLHTSSFEFNMLVSAALLLMLLLL